MTLQGVLTVISWLFVVAYFGCGLAGYYFRGELLVGLGRLAAMSALFGFGYWRAKVRARARSGLHT